MTNEVHTAEVAALYSLGPTWVHRAHPLTKLTLVPALTTLAVAAGDYAAASIAFAVLILVAVVSGVGGAAISSLRILTPIVLALLAIHVPFNPSNQTPFAAFGPITLYEEGLAFALTVGSRLAVFVVAVALALRTTHPKALVSALVERGLSHKLGYSYLAGAELIPDMKRRAREVLDAQRSRGFDTEGSLLRRARALLGLLKPLLVGALVSVETRALALESRGFSLPGKRTSTVPLSDSKLDATIRWLALLVTLLGVGTIVLR